jgi:hypothetical protein
LRAVDKFGNVLGIMPGLLCTVLGGAAQVVGQVGQRKVQKTLTDRVLKTANDEYFAPRGLVVRVCTRTVVEAMVKHTAVVKPGAGAAITNALEGFALRTRIGGRLIDAFSSKVSHLRISRGNVC